MHRKKEFVFPTFGIPPYPITSEMDPKWNFESKSVLTSSLSRNQLEYVQLMRARRMATRRRAEAACPPCKSKKARCSDFRPCARCSQLGGKNCTDGVNKHTVRATSSLITAGLSKSIHPYFYNFYLVAICAVRQRRPIPIRHISIHGTYSVERLTLSSVDALITFRETRHFAQDGADFRHARHTGTCRPFCHPVLIVNLKTQFRLGGVDVGGGGGAWEGGPVPRGLEAVPAAVGTG